MPKQPHIKTICLPVEDSQQIDNLDADSRVLTIAGWGFTEYKKNMSDVLMKATVPYLPQPACIAAYTNKMKIYSSIRVRIRDTHMCAGGVGRVDTCRGDSGSALTGFADLGDKPRIFLHGVVSMGVDCSIGEAFPGVYTRVSKFIGWILDNMKDD